MHYPNSHAYFPHLPRGLDRREEQEDAEYDQELSEAIRLGIERLGRDHPLVAPVLRALRQKEPKRSAAYPADILTACTEERTRGHEREDKLVNLVESILGDDAHREVRLPGFGHHRVDAFFPAHQLVVEENGTHHQRKGYYQKRDAALADLCRNTGLKVLTVSLGEPLTEQHLRERLNELGIAL